MHDANDANKRQSNISDLTIAILVCTGNISQSITKPTSKNVGFVISGHICADIQKSRMRFYKF
ncbi:hypothetical protein FACS1894102_5450 [Spirochaetia bacterium]|nr:hypothetical protein FACS1894102_5450 [Spirochaetia bacterium]